MTLDEALKEIERLNYIIEDQQTEIEKLRQQKTAGRKPKNEKWQASYHAFAALYEQGLSMAEIVEQSDCSRRTCYRYKAYYDNLKKKGM